jgi:hypothetical protein
MANRDSWWNQGAFRVDVWLGDSNAADITKVAPNHNQSFYYIEVESLYFRPCRVHLLKASGTNQPPRVEFSESNVRSNAWTRSPLLTLPAAKPAKMIPVRRSRRASLSSTGGHPAGDNTENIEGELEYEVRKRLPVPPLVIDVTL